MEHLKSINEIASSRTLNWQSFCQQDNSVLVLLVQASIALDEALAPTLLQLLHYALCGVKKSSSSTVVAETGSGGVKHKKEKEGKEGEWWGLLENFGLF
jgi:E3 ubiquitin-protein ligase UBR4